MSTIQDTTVRLTSQDDWEDWQIQFEGLARGKNIWDIITGDKVERELPFEPNDDDIPPAGSTRSSSTTSHADYQLAWTIYRTRLEQYNKQQMDLNKVREWMQKTVSPHIYTVTCDPSEPLKEWYDNLQKNVGIDKSRIQDLAMELYQKALKTPKQKDILSWLNNWENAMQKATKAKLPVASFPKQWIKDFLGVVRPLNPVWVESYWIAQEEKIKTGDLSFRKVSQDFRDSLSRIPNASLAKIAKGSFGPTFAAKEDDSRGDNDSEEEPVPTNKQGQKRKSDSDRSGFNSHRAAQRVSNRSPRRIPGEFNCQKVGRS
ncbi:hypothetical protein EYZ11_013269 [Aspergillus tanneri]|uniref:Uncharacterized protein n=1 Tax=Aspergillus tanneri TaxID=1220188 RepID=A0A4S3IYC4_9EURO|nr:hypothetical protein EYZ11_013269 [Aspergillus tanneri]